MKSDELLDDEIPFASPTFGNTVEPLYACRVGKKLWESYRLRHPDAPTVPPEDSDSWTDPDAAAYWVHFNGCDLCQEDGV